MKTISTYTSDKLKIISLILIISVINWHSLYNHNDIGGIVFNIKLQYLFTCLISERLSVQLFFIISGYLFFLNLNNTKTVFIKIKKRINSLLIPYLLACTFFITLSLGIALLPIANNYMNWSPVYILKENWLDIIKHIYFDYGGGAPLAYHLWFLRNLIIIIAFSPLLFYIHKYLKYYFIIPILLLDYLIPYNSLIMSLLWFYIGGALVYLDIKINLRKVAYVCLPFFLILVITQLIFDIRFSKYIVYAITIFNIITIWSSYNLFVPKNFSLKNKPILYEMCSITFFLYLFHLPIINIIKKIIIMIFGANSFGYSFGYLFTPIIFLLISLFVTTFLKKYVVNLYTLSVGGR